MVLPTQSFGGVERRGNDEPMASETAPTSLIPLSVGIGLVEDLVADIDQSLTAAE